MERAAIPGQGAASGSAVERSSGEFDGGGGHQPELFARVTATVAFGDEHRVGAELSL